ncbi:MAG: class I SAM-dependent methyltransferase [Chloracidobacterium sp.]|nr:class I SAM-dependent methyltransferase [Chloracidobacterium sp.]
MGIQILNDSTTRFSTRVENYKKYRPGYPIEVIETLISECGLKADSIIADIGSGTGILTEVFLKNGNEVYGVEPNREMREAGAVSLKDYPRFRSVAARAEETTLPESSVDFITAGQSFHWFDREKTRTEFIRILKSQGWISLIWNERVTTTTPFLVAYEKLLKDYSPDYEQIDHRRITNAVISDFFGSNRFKLKQFNNSQVFDYDGVKGRLLSSSYAPEAGHPDHEPMLAELERIFRKYQEEGQVAFDYITQMYYGRLDG